jgi:type IV secretion system protein VirD4
MMVFAGSFLSVAIFFVTTNRRSRKLMEGAEDLHGSARWASEADIDRTGLIAARQGVYVGAWRRENSQRLHYLRHNGPEHVLAFAPTRSGKGVGLVIPTLLAWSESAVIYDIKGENWAKTSGFRNQMGHLCFKFSPVEEISSRFNPLPEVRLFSLRDVSDAQNIAEMIIRSGQDSPMERHWEDAAASLTTGMVLHVCYEAALEGRIACLADLSHVFTKPGCNFRDTLVELLNFLHDPACKHAWRMPTGELTETHPVVRKCSTRKTRNYRASCPQPRRR